MINCITNKKKKLSDKLKLTHYKIIKTILSREFANYKAKCYKNFFEERKFNGVHILIECQHLYTQ